MCKVYGLTDMPKEFWKAMDNTVLGIQGVFCLVTKLYKEEFALKQSKCDFSKTNLFWLGFSNRHSY